MTPNVIRPWTILLLAFAAVAVLSGCAAAQNKTLPVPLRAHAAPALTGSAFEVQVRTLPRAEREQAILDAISQGHVPDFLRTLVPVSHNETISGTPRTVTFWVTPDYMAIGTDADFFRMPMGAPLAQQVATLTRSSLPTRRMVNAIYTAADVKLAPSPIPPSDQMTTIPVFWQHQQTIETQRAGQPLGLLVGGIKKDVVISKLTLTRPPPPRVCIYGWHYLSGEPIQPLSTAHEATYADYSHGIRLVLETVLVDGERWNLADLLQHPTLHVLVSDEGVYAEPDTRYAVPTPMTPKLGDDPVQNGSFEETFSGPIAPQWELWQAAGSSAIGGGRATLNRVDGAASQYLFRNDGTPYDGGIRQQVTLVPGTSYELRGWIKRQNLHNNPTMKLGLVTGTFDPDAPGAIVVNVSATANDTWALASQSFTATAASAWIFTRVSHTGGGTGNAYFYMDAISLAAAGPLRIAQDGWDLGNP